MISLILPPGEQVARAAKMLADEYGTASNIKSRVNRQSVLDAITSVQQRLKLYTKVCVCPPFVSGFRHCRSNTTETITTLACPISPNTDSPQWIGDVLWHRPHG